MKIAVLVSGGVDSSVALALLQAAGYDVTAFYIKIWLEDELSFLGNCPWEEDLAYVRTVCDQLHIPLEVVSLQREYWDRVVSYAIEEVKIGRTPNPDVLCNQQVKFGAFFDSIDSSFQKVATGHYAQTGFDASGVPFLKCAPDEIKDQTYFLAYLNADQLSRAMFPVGCYRKEEVREIARKFDLPNKERKDSQGICFLGKLSFEDFLAYHLGRQEGWLIEFETDERVGKHQGFWFYTVGQRKGIGLSGGPWYVVAKDVERNYVYISRSYHAADKIRDSLYVTRCNWIGDSPVVGEKLFVKLRHGAYRHLATVLERGDDGGILIQLQGRDQGIAAGQFAVFYRDEWCLGGGVIR